MTIFVEACPPPLMEDLIKLKNSKISNTVAYGTNSIYNQSINSWNIISDTILKFNVNNDNKIDLNTISRSCYKKVVTSYLLNLYQD